MEEFQKLIETLPNYARDIKLNVPYVLSPEGAPGLNEKQIATIVLSGSFALMHEGLKKTALKKAEALLSQEEQEGALSVAALMSMNNIFYRALHQSGSEDLKRFRVRLRMNALKNSHMNPVDFELSALAVSVIHGCEGCLKAHMQSALRQGVSLEGVHSVIRIASVLHGLYKVLLYERKTV